MENNYVISKELFDNLMHYLLTRPCGEVMQGVLALQGAMTLDKVLALNEEQSK